MELKSNFTTALSTIAVAALIIGAGPNEKKPVTTPPVTTTANPAKNDPAKTPQVEKKPVATDTFEDDPTETTTKDAVVPGTNAPKTGPRVLVLPFQPIFRSVQQGKIDTANNLLLKELDQKDLQIVRGGVAKPDVPPPVVSNEGFQKATAEAVKAEADREIVKAIAARKAAIAEMEKNAAAVDPDDYVAAHHYLARAIMWSGEDKAAQDVIDVAVRMRPSFVLEPAEFSRLYRKWVTKAAEKALADKPGDLMVRAALPGAAITLDGRTMDVAPVLLKKVIPGKHLIGAKIEGVPPFAAIVDVKPGNKNEFTAVFSNTMGGASVGVVADAIAENGIPKKAVEAAAAAGKDAGASFVVLGGLAKDEDRFKVHTYVVDVQKSSIKPLDVVDYDLDMLTAESDVLRVVQNIYATVGSFASSETAVATISRRITRQPTINEVAAAPTLGEETSGKETPGELAKKKGPRGPIKPLGGSKVEIKDEKNE